MAFSRDEYVRECQRKAAFFRRLAAAIALAGAVFFAFAWALGRKALVPFLGIDPAAAIISAACLSGVAVALLLGEYMEGKAPPSNSL